MFYRIAVLIAFPCAFAQPAHERARHEFSFHLEVPYQTAAPLFGAWAEKKWDPEWKPEFLYPVPAVDEEGAVFVVAHGEHRAVWTNTIFDLEGGHVQYVYVLDRVLVTRIDIRLSRAGGAGTDVRVAYERTALEAAANERVKSMGERDGGQGPEWKRMIEAAVKR